MGYVKALKLCLFSLLLSRALTDSDSGVCSADSSSDECNSENEHKAGKYSEESAKWEEYRFKIQKAVSNYKDCDESDVCSCYSSQIDKDLKPWASKGITKAILDSIHNRGARYQIVNHKVYRDPSCMFPSRCNGVEYFLTRLAHRVPDMELILNTRDWPQIKDFWPEPKPPLFSFSKDSTHIDIMYPAWAFWEGGPAISLHPTGIGRWDLTAKKIIAAGETTSWSEKASQGFFRGSRTSAQRDPLVLLARAKPELVDAQYTKNQAWKSKKDTLGAEPASEVSFEDHCKYKYLFNFRGVAASFRLKHLFLCHSLVFHVDSEWLEFFYPRLVPWVHYIPVKEDLSDAEDLLKFAMDNDQVAQEIAERGFNFIRKHLTLDHVFCYWDTLLHKYAKLLKFTVERNSTLKAIKHSNQPYLKLP